MRDEEVLGGRYRLVERLGAGGMSVVWVGFDQVLGRRVAIKVLNPVLAQDAAFRRRLRLEARAAARLNHPHITNVYDYGESVTPGGDPVPYVVMELVDGLTLSSRLARGRSMPVSEAALTCAQIGAALDAAHRRGIVHRDVTPGNVMLTSTGAKILDFGISALVGEVADSDGSILGTPAYLAPERLAGQPATAATDVYGLGLIFYRAAAGRLPFDDVDTKTEMLRAHLYRQPNPLPDLDGLPSSLADLCLRSLAKDPADRPSTTELTHAYAAVADIAIRADSTAPPPDAAEDPSEATTATTLLPSWQETHAVVAAESTRTARTPTRNRARHGRRVSILVTAAAVVTGIAWAWIGNPWVRDADSAYAASVGLGQRATGCAVDYRIRADSGTSFTADLTVANRGVTPLHDWSLTFTTPGNAQLRTGSGATWRQDGRALTAQAPADNTVGPDASARLSFSADYTGINGLPVAVRVDDDICATTVTGVAVHPAAPSNRPSTTEPGTGAAPATLTVKKAPKPGKDSKTDKPAKKKKAKPADKGKSGGKPKTKT